LAVVPVFALRGVRQVKAATEVLAGVELEIPGQAVTALVGPSGAGKTSLLRLLNRLDDPAEGEILYHSRPLTEFPVRELRCKVGFVFQTPVMFPGTVLGNLREAAELAGNPADDLAAEMRAAMELAELDWALADREGERLSVGQKQRVNIARALMTRPEVLLMDEPTSALDPETADRLTETIRHLSTERGLTVVMIMHRLAEARRVSDFTVVMEAGRVIEVGPTPEVFGQTGNARIRAFLESGR
jgi:ABC-type methionine transport system ATPase subunit